MHEGFMSLAGNEIVNSARAVAYAEAAGLTFDCTVCEHLPDFLGDDPYEEVGPDAPWWDPGQPQSWGFLGVYGLQVAGFDSNPIERTPIPLVGDGSALGTLRRRHREISFTVGLFAVGECQLVYGLEWLASALRGSQCTGGCNGDELCMFSCCPGCVDIPAATGEPGDGELRHLYDVGLLEGPAVTDVETLDGDILFATVSFTLVAGKPYVYREPLAAGIGWVPLGGGELVTATDPDAVYAQCKPPKPCSTDPLCSSPPMPPKPPVPLSPCYTTGRGTFRRTRLSVSPIDDAIWLESVPLIEVRAGSQDMRRLLIRFWANRQGNPCDVYNDPCNACTDINVSYLPANSHLIIDGRTGRSVVECQQVPVGVATSTPTVYGPKGGLFQYPVFVCPTGLCIEVWSHSGFTASDATARVLMVPRADMG
ncbi:hypothetical protein ACIRPQ_28845 [Streptomyces sp. NPDC101213]|uniref:hypothetical protein n=1 Tax=Streptomyces sp. NPDC101213 TaxID=3366130 RepID=UPI0038219AE3